MPVNCRACRTASGEHYGAALDFSTMLGAQRSTADGDTRPRILMLGLGWFPDSIGGLDRYYRALLEALPEADGVVVGPAGDAPPRVTAVAEEGRGLIRRLSGYSRAARRAARGAQLIDAHFALYAL